MEEDDEKEENSDDEEESDEDDDDEPKPIKWKLRYTRDYESNLADLAENPRNELKKRYEASLSPFMLLLHRCLDSGVLFDNICGSKIPNQAPVDKATFMKVEQSEFQRCVIFVSQLPHVIPHIANGSLDLAPEFAEVIFWQLKKASISVVWGDFFPQYFVELFIELFLPLKDCGLLFKIGICCVHGY